MTLHGIQLKACLNAFQDAGLTGKQIDGIMPFPNLGSAEGFSASLGCSNLRYAAIIHMGGASPVASLQSAAAAVAAGIANYVLIPAGWNGYSGARARQTVQQDGSSLPGGTIARDFYMPNGLTAPPQWYALMARRHMHEYGTTPEQLGAIALAMRKHAQLNDNALMQGHEMTMESYLNSPMITDPYKLFDCCIDPLRRLMPSRWPGLHPRMWTLQRSTTASLSRCCSRSKKLAFASVAKAGPLWKTDALKSVVPCL
jgi:acetyl-CoA acetyltransferase